MAGHDRPEWVVTIDRNTHLAKQAGLVTPDFAYFAKYLQQAVTMAG